MPRRRTLLDPPFIRVGMDALYRCAEDKTVRYQVSVDLPGDPADAVECEAATEGVAQHFAEWVWMLSEHLGHGTLLRVLRAGSRLCGEAGGGWTPHQPPC